MFLVCLSALLLCWLLFQTKGLVMNDFFSHCFNWTDAQVIQALIALDAQGGLEKNNIESIILKDLLRTYHKNKALSSSQIQAIKKHFINFYSFLTAYAKKHFKNDLTTIKQEAPYSVRLHNPKNLRVYIPPNTARFKYLQKRTGLIKHKSEPFYLCPATKYNIYVFKYDGFHIDKRALSILDTENLIENQTITCSQLPLFPYQLEGVSFICAKNGRALIADEMGIGKTAQAIAYVGHTGHKKIIVIVPSIFKLGFKNEIIKFIGPEPCFICEGKTVTEEAQKALQKNKWIIINYDIVSEWEPYFEDLGATCLICDEAHMLKNKKALRTQTVKTMSTYIKDVILLSGTPIENRNIEFYSLLDILGYATIFKSFMTYAKIFSVPVLQKWGYDFRQNQNTHLLYKTLVDLCMIRRLKKDVLPYLPPKRRMIIPIELPNKTLLEYKTIEYDFISWLRSIDKKKAIKAKRAEILTKITALKAFVAHAKLSFIKAWIDNYLESGEKLVIFGWHTDILTDLYNTYKKQSILITGQQNNLEKRQIDEKAFQNNPNIKLCFANIIAGGKALTLTAASATLTYELMYNNSVHDQAEDRIHRHGQTKTAMAYYLLANDTIDIRLAERIENKRKLMHEVLEGAQTKQNESLFDELLQNLMS